MRKLFIFMLFLSAFGFAETNKEWKCVYLTSFPRSGNHWLRYLIEDATGIATSSVYQDRKNEEEPHLKRKFPWGGFCADHGYKHHCRYPKKGDIVVLKTHFPCIKSKKISHDNSIKAIRIVRNPVDAIYSYYIFSHKNKGKNGKINHEFFSKRLEKFKKYQAYWNKQNVPTYRYEDILANPNVMLAKILKQMGYQVSQEDIDRAVLQNPPTGHELKHLSKFTQKQLKTMRKELKPFLNKFEYKIPLRKGDK